MRGLADSRIRTVLYSPDEVYRLYGFVGYHLDLEFASDESFVGLSAGDPEAVTYSAHENVLTLRPKAASSQMNLTVSTTKRRYYFEYTIAAHPASRFADEVMYAVRFMYPANPAAQGSLTPEQRVARDLALAQKNRPRNIDYWFCGNAQIKPIAASDDGVHTRLTFAAKAELPAIFVRNDDGSESLLNFSMDAGDVVIHRVAAIHRAPRPLDRLHREQRLCGGRRAAGIGHHRPRRDARTQGRSPMSPSRAERAEKDAPSPIPGAEASPEETGAQEDTTAFAADPTAQEPASGFDQFAGERGENVLHRARSLQSRASQVLALGLMGALGVGLLGWYYVHTFAQHGAAQRTAQTASRNQAAGDAPLPSLGPIDLPEVPVEKILGAAPEAPTTTGESSAAPAGVSAPVAGSSQPPVKSPAEMALERRLAGPAFSRRSDSDSAPGTSTSHESMSAALVGSPGGPTAGEREPGGGAGSGALQSS